MTVRFQWLRLARGILCRMPAENSTRETQPLETYGHRGWIEVSVARPVSTSQQTGDGDVKPHQPSDEASQQAVPIWYGIKSSINKDFLKVIWLCGHLASTKRRKWRLNEPLKRPPIKTFGAVGRKSFKEIFKKISRHSIEPSNVHKPAQTEHQNSTVFKKIENINFFST